MQASVGGELRFLGVGVHRGISAEAVIKPAGPDTGIVFQRTDLVRQGSHSHHQASISARYDSVCDTRLCTVIGNTDGATVSTIEHVMAALAAHGIDNALIEIDGPEMPIMDGSSAAFCDALSKVERIEFPKPSRALRILKKVEVVDGDKSAALMPSRQFELSFEIDFPDAAIGRQASAIVMGRDAFDRELAAARTFCRRHEIEQLRAAGLARGGSLENAVVVDGAEVLNPEGLRYRDEFVRHKLLDAVGDLRLAGAPILGRYRGIRAGHGITNQLLRALFADPTAWGWVEAPATQPLASQER
ncbi:MAG: UDP-3-O-acyl-N-acetylglucosamine deacetylase, partial [Pseudomonadota bacterium]